MDAPSITTRVADLVRNPDSAMPGKWEHSSKNKQIESYSAETSKPEIRKPAPPPIRPGSSPSEASGSQTTTLSSGDTLTLSPLAIKILEEPATGESDWEKARNERVQRVQQLMQDKQYSLSPEMVDDIAHKIVAMLR